MPRWVTVATNATSDSTGTPGDVTILSAEPTITKDGVIVEIVYDPPSPIGAYSGVHAYTEAPALTGQEGVAGQSQAGQFSAAPDQKRIDSGKYPMEGAGQQRIRLKAIAVPETTETWRVYLCSYSDTVEVPLIPGTTSSITFTVSPDAGLGMHQEYAPNPTNPRVVSTEREWRESQWVWRVTIAWDDPTYEANKATYDRFAGVDVVLEDPQGTRERVRVAKGVQTFTSSLRPVPATQQTWTAWLPGVDVDGRANTLPARYEDGRPYVTPYVRFTINAPSTVEHVSNFSVSVGYGANPATGQRALTVQHFFTPPDDPTWSHCIIYCRAYNPVPQTVTWVALGEFWRGDGSEKSYIPPDCFPTNDEEWTFYVVSEDVNGNLNGDPLVSTAGLPSYGPVTVWAPPLAASVTNVSGYLWQGTNEDGVSIYGFGGDFDEPDDPAYAGCSVYARYQRQDQTWYTSAALAIIARGGVTEWRTEGWPLTESHNWELRYCSYDADGRETPIEQAPRYPSSPSQWLMPSATQGQLKADRITGQIKTAQIEDGAVTMSKIMDGAVSELKIAAGAVSEQKLADLAVTAAKLASGAVTTDKILDGAINNLKLAAGSVTNAKLADLAVDAAKLANSAVTATKIANAAVGSAAIAAAAVGEAHIASAAITSAKIANAAVGSAAIAALAVGDAHIANVSATKINTGTLYVGGSGMAGQISVANTSNQKIGWIGTESSYSGGWFKNLWVGGSGPSDAPLVSDSAGKVTLNVSTAAYKLALNPNDTYPFRVYETGGSPANEVRISSSAVEIGGYYGLYMPSVALSRTSTQASVVAAGSSMRVTRMIAQSTSVELYAGLSDYARYFQIYADTGVTSEMRLSNMGVVVDGYSGQTVDVPYAKPGGGSGTLSFRRGFLVSAT